MKMKHGGREGGLNSREVCCVVTSITVVATNSASAAATLQWGCMGGNRAWMKRHVVGAWRQADSIGCCLVAAA